MTNVNQNAHSLARELAAELRAISEQLAAREVGAEALSSALEFARQIGACVDGPLRTRWYDRNADSAAAGAVGASGDSGRSYLEQSPVRGELNPIAPPLRVEVGERGDGTPVVRGFARLGRAYEGPPHGVHGGWIAALFDDLLGAAQGLAGRPGVTGILEVKYRQVTPLDEDLRFEGWIAEQRGRRLIARGTCHAGDTLTAQAKGMFVRVDFDEVADQMRARRGG